MYTHIIHSFRISIRISYVRIAFNNPDNRVEVTREERTIVTAEAALRHPSNRIDASASGRVR